MDERPVGLRHLVKFFAPSNGRTLSSRRVQQLCCQTRPHRLSRSRPCATDQPTHGQRHPTIRCNLDGHLIRSTTNTARLHLNCWSRVPHRLVKNLKRVTVRLFLNQIKRLVHTTLCNRLFPAVHHSVDETRQILVPELRVWLDHSFYSRPSPRHTSSITSRFLTLCQGVHFPCPVLCRIRPCTTNDS